MKVITHLISIIIAFSLTSENNHIKQITVPLSSPDGPGILIVNHHKGSINVTGYAGDSVIVRASMPFIPPPWLAQPQSLVPGRHSQTH